MNIVLWIIAAYLIGGIPFGYLIGKMRGVDVRTVGSKNIGATNVYRTVGKKWGFLAFFCDFLKGFLPTLLAMHQPLPVWGPTAVGFACVLGHTLTPYMKFKGGKGVATAFGMMMALITVPVSIAFAVFVVTVWRSHYISLGSILAAAVVATLVWFYPAILPLRVLVTLLGVFIVWKHKSNIERLVKGCENRIY